MWIDRGEKPTGFYPPSKKVGKCRKQTSASLDKWGLLVLYVWSADACCIQWTSSQNFMWLFGFLIYICWICLSFIPAFFCNQSCGGLLESVPAVLREMQITETNERRPFTLTSWQFSLLLICIFLDCGRKLKNLLETPENSTIPHRKAPCFGIVLVTHDPFGQSEWLTSLADMSRHSQW